MRFSAFVAVLLLTMPSLAAADGEESYRTRGFDTQFRTSGGDILLLRREGDAYREAAIEPYVDSPSYHGSYTGNRHSPLDQTDRDNVGRLAMQWFFPIPDMPMIEGTPVVIAGVIYVTAVNQVYALDAATGRDCAASSTPIAPRPASARGVSGRFPRRASRGPRHGATRRCCAAAAAPPG